MIRLITLLLLATAAYTPLTLRADNETEPLPPASSRKDVTFKRDIQPIFEQSCVKCHGAKKAKAHFERAYELANLDVGGGASLLEKVDNRPLEVLGDWVAYPCVDPAWSEKIMKTFDNLPLPEIPVQPLQPNLIGPALHKKGKPPSTETPLAAG